MRAHIALLFGILIACSNDKDDAHGSNDETDTSRSETARVALDVKSFCNKVVNTCGNSSTSISECQKTFAAVRVTPDCAEALGSARCSDFTSGSSTQTRCFPRCEATENQSCNPDGTLSTCGSTAELVVLDCQTACSVAGQTWTGECGTSGNGQTSKTEKCWCK